MAQSAKPEKKVFTNIRIAATGDFDYFITDFSYAHPPPKKIKLGSTPSKFNSLC